MKRTVFAVLLLSAVFVTLLLSGCSGERKTVVSSHTIMDNGVIIAAKENRASEVVALHLYVRDAALFETAEDAGAANILRTLMFAETETRGPGEIQQSIEDFGGYMSTNSRHDFIQYAFTFPSESFKDVVDAIADGLTHPVFNEDRLERAKLGAERAISKMLRWPVDRGYRLCLAEMMGDHPYGRLAEGTPEAFGDLTVEDMTERHARMYVGPNIVVAIAGNIDPVMASRYVADALEAVPAGEPAEPTAPPVTWPDETRRVTERAPVGKTCQVLGFPGPYIGHTDDVTMDVLLVLLMEGRSSRLNTRLKEELDLVYKVGAGWYTMIHPSPLFVWMELPPENTTAAEEAVLELFAELADEPVSGAELAKVQVLLESGSLRMVETAEGQAFFTGYWNSVGDEEFANQYVDRLAVVTADEVQRAAALYLNTGAHVTAVITPE